MFETIQGGHIVSVLLGDGGEEGILTHERLLHALTLDIDLVDHFGSFNVDGIILAGEDGHGGD